MDAQSTDSLKECEIQCPNCELIAIGQYDTKDIAPAIYGKCSFCNTLFKWTPSKTVEVINADKRQYHYHLEWFNRMFIKKIKTQLDGIWRNLTS